MSPSKFTVYSPATLLGFSICMLVLVVADLVFVPRLVLIRHDYLIQSDSFEQSWPGIHEEREQKRANFREKYGFWGSSRKMLYLSFVLPPLTGIAIAVLSRRHIRNLLLRNQDYFKKEMRRRLIRWDGIGLGEFREAVSILPRFLPVLMVIILLFLLDAYFFRRGSSVSAFMSISGFICYPTWKRMYIDATSGLDSKLEKREIEGVKIL